MALSERPDPAWSHHPIALTDRTAHFDMPGKLFENRKQAEDYVAHQLRDGIPEGWTWTRPDPRRLWWLIKRTFIPPGEWPDQDYGLIVSEDLHWFFLTYGNHDIGPGTLPQEFQAARVISAPSLETYPLAACVRFMVQHCKPNEWGYT